MTGAIRCGVTAFVVVVSGFSTGGTAEAQRKRAPSVLLPLETMWTSGLPDAPAWAPVHAEGRLFVALQDGHVVAVGLSDGEVQWTIEQAVVAQPAIGDWRLFVAGPDELMALDTRTGGRFWSIPLEAPLSAPLVWDMQWLIATLEGGTVLALRGADGETVWRRTLDASIDVPPAVAGDRVYVSLTDGGLAALSLSDGTSVWQRQLDGAPQEVLPLDDLFVGAGDHNFYRLSHRDGSEQWRWSTGGDIVGVPVVDEKRVFFSSLDNVVWALDRASGVQRWRQPLTARPTAGPSYVRDLVVFGGLSRQIAFYEPSDGTLYGRVSVPTDLAFPPLHLEGMPGDPTLVFVTGDGRLQALGPSTVPRVLDPGVTPILGTPPAKPNLLVEDGVSDAAGPDPAATTDLGATAALEAATDLAATAGPEAATDLGATAGPAVATDLGATGDPDAIPEVAAPVNEALAVLTPVPPLVLSTADEPASDLNAAPAPAGATSLVAQPAASPTPNGAEDAPASPFADAREYAIEIAAFDNVGTAVALADELADAGYPAYVVDPQPGDAPQLYRVRIGDFPDRASAETAGARITDDQAPDWRVVALP
jgi:outer membrane protein assembly factor BamB/cell division septation protein DedD